MLLILLLNVIFSKAISASVEDGAFVHLFEWKWTDISEECEKFLGPNEFHAVQVSPAMEHIKGDPWWTRYQPVSYKLESRSGSQDEFEEMIQRCKKVGVSIIIDGVINHMAAPSTNGDSYGINGTNYHDRQYEPYDYDASKTHTTTNDQTNCKVDDYSDANNVQQCDLEGLVDLNTERDDVQDIIANYIKTYHDLGVAGYRVDAAKHIKSDSMGAIINKAPSMYCFQEVIAGTGEPITPEQYTGFGDVTEFNFGINIYNVFKVGAQNMVRNLDTFGEKWGLIESDLAVTFTDNHDTQRSSSNVLTYKDGYNYDMANYFMLAHPYGHPKVMSSYYFDNSDQGPPGVNVYTGNTINCDDGRNWVCEHRRTGISGMVRFRSVVGDVDDDNYQKDDNNGNRIAFARSGKGFIAINMDPNEYWNTNLYTSLPDGDYCNVIISKYKDCDGNDDAKVKVENGNIKVNIPNLQALAIHV